MPDLQTEIFKKVLPNLNTLKFDDAGDHPVEEVKTPLTRQIFDFIKDKSGKVIGKQVLDHFEAKGYKRSVVAASTQAVINDGRAVRKGGKLSVTRSEYDKPKVAKVTSLPKKVVQNKISEYEREQTKVFDVDILLGTLSMYQGRELYLRLKAIYGG